MNKDKSFLRHEVLNIITLVNFLVIDSKIDKRAKEEILEHLKMVGLMIAEEDLFLGKKKAFFNQPIDLNETLQIIKALVEKKTQKKGVKLSMPSTNLVIHADASVIKNGLEQLLNYVIEHAHVIQIGVSEVDNNMQIVHDVPDGLFKEEMPLLDLLKEKNNHYSETFFRVALEIMKMNRIQLSFEPKKITIQFPKK